MKSIGPVAKLSGKIKAPASKSMMQRAVAASMLAGGDNIIKNPSFSEDAMVSVNIVKKISKGIKKDMILQCGESGLCLRLFSVIAALYDEPICLTGTGTLLERDCSMIESSLNQLGVECKTNNGKAPVYILGPITPGNIMLDGGVTSQLLSGLLMVLPVCDGDSKVIVNNLKSKPYIDMTISLLNDFGIMVQNKDYREFIITGNQVYSSIDYTVEGDWSSAAFMLVAGAISGSVELTDISASSHQGDKVILDILKQVGAKVVVKKSSVSVSSAKELAPFEFDASECPDLVPPLIALAVNCKGQSRISGTERLKFKESDRVKTLLSEFKNIGASIEHKDNLFTINGQDKIAGGEIKSHNDHRIVMACSIAGLFSKNGIRIMDGWQCVKKSYPEFFNDLEKLI